MDWYSIRVISGKEQKIEEAIVWEVEDQNLQDQIQEIFVPTEKIVEMKDGKKKVKTKVFFPGYVLLKMELTNETRYLIENVNKGSPHFYEDGLNVRLKKALSNGNFSAEIIDWQSVLENEILLIFRNGVWDLPKGKIEYNERDGYHLSTTTKRCELFKSKFSCFMAQI